MNSSGDDGGLDALRRRVGTMGAADVGDLALERGWIAPAQLRTCQEIADRTGRPLDRVLVERGLLTESRLAELRGARPKATATMPSEVEAAALDPARRFGRFVRVREIGHGGMGVVDQAWQTDLGRWIALKRLKLESDDARRRFLREAQLAARVVHPGLVPLYEVGEIEGVPYLAMAWIDGGSLEGRSLPIREALDIIRQAALAAEALHAVGIVHRDIKPANLFRDSSGRAYLGDFGLARERGPGGLTRTGALLGTPAYAPPEQVRGDPRLLGPRSDVYALGATLYSLLTGEPPFRGKDPFETAQRSLDTDPPPLALRRPEASRQIQTILSKAMRKLPAERYASAAVFAEDVRRCLDGETLLAKPPGPGEHVRAWLRRHRGAVAGAAMLLVVAGLAGSALAWQRSRFRESEAKRQAEADALRRAADRTELFWRAEALSRDMLRWADVARRTGGADPAEAAARRRDLESSLQPLRSTPDGDALCSAILARFTAVAEDPVRGEETFAAMPEHRRRDPLILLHRFRARLSMYVASVPPPAFYLSASLEAEIRTLPATSAARWQALMLEDCRRIREAKLDADLGGALSNFLDGCEALAVGDGGRAAARFAETEGRPELGDDGRFLTGFALLHLGEYENAVASWEALLRRDPSRPDVRLGLVAALVAHAARRATLDPGSAEPLLERAEGEARRLTAEVPRLAQPWSWLGTLVQIRIKYAPRGGSRREAIGQMIREGIEHYRRATERQREPAFDIARGTLLGLLAEAEELEGVDPRPALRESIAVLRSVRGSEGTVVQETAKFNLAAVLLRLADRERSHGEVEASRSCYEESLTILDSQLEGPGTDRALPLILRGTARLGLCRLSPSAGQWLVAPAAEDLRAGAEAAADRPRLQLLAARSLLSLGQTASQTGPLRDSAEAATHAWEGGLRTAEVHAVRAEARYELGRRLGDGPDAEQEFRDAEDDFSRAAELAPTNPQHAHQRGLTRQQLAGLQRSAKRGEDSSRLLKGAEADHLRAALLAPSEPVYPYQAGVAAAIDGRLEDALAHLKRARDLKPRDRMLGQRIEERIRAIEAGPSPD